ncbi:unnamed protein product [Sphenostylis stenocarpa]|uniref:Acid invertase n=1 Tax=Sphenostylis stenocarpa TaxID=92480 RepID=A0AA86SBU3_9FABA|nr:unnamed protein product [Sphenostylis stenocarpa]
MTMPISAIFLLTLFSVIYGTASTHHLRHTLSSDSYHQPYRTAYHFQPPKNWINGPLRYGGLYHLFYQYNPKGTVWGNIIWAHSVSKDLVNWTPLDPAIFPSQPSDVNGCWSGSATLLPGNKPAILYTGINPLNQQVQNLAKPKNLSDPFLREWVKSPKNPLMAPTSANKINASSFRDPTTAWLGQDGHWRVLVGSKRGTRGMALLYRSKDFVDWVQAKDPLHSILGSGMWECPDFFPVLNNGQLGVDTSVNGDYVRHVLKVSLDDKKHDYYMIGSYNADKDAFIPDKGFNEFVLRYDYGKYYASKSFFDDGKKRRVLLGWVNESSSVADDIKKGWSGIHTIPRAIWLHKSGKQLVLWPVEEIEKLRANPVNLPPQVLEGGKLLQINGVTATQADVEISFSFEKSKLRKAEVLNYWRDPQILCSTKGSSLRSELGPFGLLVFASEGLQEFTSIDHSVVESFEGEGRGCITARVYPTLAIDDKAQIYAFNNGSAEVMITRLSAWSMKKAQIN